MRPLGRSGSVWRLIGSMRNLYVRYLLCPLKTDFIGWLSVTVGVLDVIQGKLKLKLVDVGSATPSPSTTRRYEKPISWTKSMVAGSIPVRLSHFILGTKNEMQKM